MEKLFLMRQNVFMFDGAAGGTSHRYRKEYRNKWIERKSARTMDGIFYCRNSYWIVDTFSSLWT
ncbi:hypothetical protein [Prevotella sp.]|uniref:hypothetical protein n=1 Tax=Prevotella sp. TaxID=59823 RepID=UPI001CB52CB6|nr:hypothetical protein [Prevotella sp.]MBF1581742.1 hypothetical protein [Prevotella sp.]